MLDSKEIPMQVEHATLKSYDEPERIDGTIIVHRITTAEAEAREHGNEDQVTVKTWTVVVVCHWSSLLLTVARLTVG